MYYGKRGGFVAIVLISYDVSINHAQMKQRLIAAGYRDVLSTNRMTINLPNTTLVKSNTTAAQAKIDMQNVASIIGARLQRAISVEINQFADGIIGDPHS